MVRAVECSPSMLKALVWSSLLKNKKKKEIIKGAKLTNLWIPKYDETPNVMCIL